MTAVEDSTPKAMPKEPGNKRKRVRKTRVEKAIEEEDFPIYLSHPIDEIFGKTLYSPAS